MTARTLASVGVVVAVVSFLGSGRGFGQTPSGYKAPRTAWGDPDLQGIWPGTAMVGVPIQRSPEFGTRNVLTDQEFTARRAAAERQNEEDNAEFDIDNVPQEVIARGTVGGPVSPPPHWLERGEPSRQASLIVDPADGRMPRADSRRPRRATRRGRRAAAGAGPRTPTRTAATTTAASPAD